MNERWYKAAMQPSPIRAAVRGHAEQRVLAHEAVEANFYKYQPFMRRAAQQFVREHRPEMVRWEGGQDKEFWVAFVNLPRVHRLRQGSSILLLLSTSSFDAHRELEI